MPEKKPTQASASGAKKPQRSSSTATATARSSAPRSGGSAKSGKPAPRKSGSKSTPKNSPKNSPKGTPKKDAPRKQSNAERELERAERKSRFMRYYLPCIFGAVALFLLICFALDLFSNDGGDPSAHRMGVFGYFICHTLFGCFTWAAYLIPVVLAVMVIFWRRYNQTGHIISKIVTSVSLILLCASFSQVIACTVEDGMNWAIPELWESGMEFKSGGVIGGLLGNILYWALRLPGTIVLTVIVLPLIIITLAGVTPRDIILKVKDRIAESRSNRDIEADEDDEDITPAPVAPKASKSKKRRDEADDESEDGEEVEDGEPYDVLDDEESEASAPGRASAAKKGAKGDRRRSTITVDTQTGEILEAEDESESRAADKPRSSESSDEELEEDTSAYSPASGKGERRRNRFSDRDRRADSRQEDRFDRSDPSQEDEAPWDEDQPTAPPSIVNVRSSGYSQSPDEVDDIDGVRETTEVDEADEDDEMEYAEIDLEEDSPVVPERKETIEVHVNRPDHTAVANTGLSEEELVLPSGTGVKADADSAAAEDAEPVREYQFPDIEMLTRGPDQYASNDDEIAENTQILRDVLKSFRIGVKEISCSCGPTITRFEVKPDTGVRVRSIANLLDDIAMGLAKAGVRIEAPIPGKSAVGIEVPNAEPDTVFLRNILETPEFRGHKSRIAACLGADVAGRPVILDINKMPHLLIAGATGTGKSVCINSLIMSILFKAKPDEVKLILIDPKKVEFAMYRDLPHLYAPVVSDPKKAAGALNSAVNEMERRFELIEEVGVRNLAGYNEITAGDPERPPLPQMVIIIDELADLMMTAPAEVETAICRLAQKARAAGIHLIIGTQRPSVDVITGLIKANVPSRIAFTVKSGVDSRTILDTVGADKLIGRGDMLYAPIGSSKPIRAQGCFVSETEVERVVTFIKENNDGPVYNEEFARSMDMEAAKCGSKKKGGDAQMSSDDFDDIGGGSYPGGEDPKFWEALEIAVTKDKIGTSALQRGCNLGYGRAAKIIDRMEELGFVGPDPGTKQGRKVLISKQDLIQYKLNGLPTGASGTRDSETDDEDDFM